MKLRYQGSAALRKAAIAVVGSSALAVSSAHAALPAGVSDAIDDALADVTSAGGYMITLTLGVLAIALVIRMFRR